MQTKRKLVVVLLGALLTLAAASPVLADTTPGHQQQGGQGGYEGQPGNQNSGGH
jgi:hypothetical protein